MSEHSGTGSPGRRWWLIALGALAVLALGVGLGNAVRTKNDPPQPGPAEPGSPSSPAPAGPLLAVTAGQGGSKKAADGRTPLGYPRTCEGAVAAATNYVSSATRLEWVQRHGDALLGQISVADTQRIAYHREGMRTALTSGITMESRPEWGGFRLVACDPSTATVNVWECEVQRYQGQSQRSCTAVTTTLNWIGDDWKLRRYEVPAEPPVPAVTPDPAPGGVPLPTDQRRQALQAAGPGWQEYANAPQ